jgi:DNA uptake protein ComE-like DNA-binding protein
MKKNILVIMVVPLSLMFLCTMVFAADKKASSKPGPSKPAITETKAAAELIDINTAMKVQLVSLPGIGEAYAQKIIDNRPYKRKDELTLKKVIPAATYTKIKDMIIVKQSK